MSTKDPTKEIMSSYLKDLLIEAASTEKTDIEFLPQTRILFFKMSRYQFALALEQVQQIVGLAAVKMHAGTVFHDKAGYRELKLAALNRTAPATYFLLFKEHAAALGIDEVLGIKRVDESDFSWNIEGAIGAPQRFGAIASFGEGQGYLLDINKIV